MRIPLSCMQCFKERGQPDDVLYPAELQDSGLYRLVCRTGHETFTCVQEQKFEVLFELALNAIVDGYYREAVASFSSSLERFYEFYVRVLCVKRGLDEATVASAWKPIAKQSERQFGVYVFTYLLENGSVAAQLPEAQVAFRNEVIHNGKIPSRDEAVKYGQAVLHVIAPILDVLKKDEDEHVGKVVLAHIQRTRQQVDGAPNISFMSIATTVSIARAHTEPQPDVVASITRLSERRHRSGW